MFNFQLSGNKVPATVFAAGTVFLATWAMLGAIVGVGAALWSGQPLWVGAVGGQIAWEAITALVRR